MSEVKDITSFERILSEETKKILDEVEIKDYGLDVEKMRKIITHSRSFDLLPKKFQIDILTSNNIKKLLAILKNTYHLPLYEYKSETYVNLILNDSTIHGNRKIVTKKHLSIYVPGSSKSVVIDFDTAGRNISYIKCCIYGYNSKYKIELVCEDITSYHKRFKLVCNDNNSYFTDFILSKIPGKLNICVYCILEEDLICLTPVRVVCSYLHVIQTELCKFLLYSINNKTRINYHIYSNYCIIKKKMHESDWKSYKIKYEIYDKTSFKEITRDTRDEINEIFIPAPEYVRVNDFMNGDIIAGLDN